MFTHLVTEPNYFSSVLC